MKKVILEIDPLWQEIADDSPESLNGRSVNKNSYATGVIGELAVSQPLASLGIGHSNHFMLTNYLRNQQCEAYIVAAINFPENSVYIMGCCAKFWFWETGAAKDYKKGEQIFKKPIREDARNMKFKHLTSIYELPLLLEALK